ncbi:MAG: GntR family transcriptional regulator [Verrucomicrobia bacterium]|nr:GntR family transcriptional regulator [Verrucomicrobiota bacterium]
MTRAEPCWLQIERHFERLISDQTLRSNQRLPPAYELAKTFRVSYKVVQRAMQHLKARGLIARAPRWGSFVRPPSDKAVIGVLAGPNLLATNGYFCRALVEALKNQIVGRGFHERIYDCLNQDAARNAPGKSLQVIGDMRNQVFKGLVSLNVAPGQVKSEVFAGDLPKVVFGGSSHETAVILDDAGFARLAVEHLVQQGRRRPIYLRFGDTKPGCTHDLDGFWDAMKTHRLKVGRQSVHQVKELEQIDDRSIEQIGYDTTTRLVNEWPRSDQRPDSLIVGDDILMKGVALALRDRRVAAPKQVLVMTQASEGLDHYYAVPVTRVEIAPVQIAQHLLDVLWLRILGRKTPPLPVKVPFRIKTNNLISSSPTGLQP